ncbi:c-type cytochrome [Granulibacter bethesdensis]|uniref:Cytochrome c-553i n=1 Tax=Granulibacter bethesdensis (strain ATCC BAA-1260 / CGDNIH1) TaxID=391165 RepID=Q0BQT3_GRABC|nr:c-type cytochrome [Granulibacter bethesdensis]ABI62819.1 Cytochrome c-553i precursor [Granulibacter bethesdensis CGDNIH1]AHJ65617.1 Cytochrome c-553i precursor [Granulibacter bethesdensis CGDNIH4]AHJ68230.1 Cytochrome c-553i precursor [Granulibacter bethesdensis]APH52682.1 Cytochrome c-553i precursor [Granulibacter bethesdensis]APH57743.1 Cytochrome c-553i precursor [Granulibacter bethesdensis]
MPHIKTRLAAVLLSVAFAGGAISAAHADDAPDYKKHVKDGKGDKTIAHGYNFYGDNCLRCHGPDGSGSSYAPNLTNSLKTMSYDTFTQTVINGRKNVSTTSDSVMPAFGEVADVVNNLDSIYMYLKARSDGALGRGRPKRFDD